MRTRRRKVKHTFLVENLDFACYPEWPSTLVDHLEKNHDVEAEAVRESCLKGDK